MFFFAHKSAIYYNVIANRSVGTLFITTLTQLRTYVLDSVTSGFADVTGLSHRNTLITDSLDSHESSRKTKRQ